MFFISNTGLKLNMFRRIVMKNYDISIKKSETALENDAYVLLELESDMSASQA